MELPGFKYGLKQLSTKSQHPEIFNAPWMPSGMSNGGNLSYELNAQRPTKVITFMSNKGGYYSHLRPEAAALSNPGVLIAGQLDDALHHEVIQELFTGNRPRGALWVAMEEEGVAHNTGNAREFFYPYLEAMFRVRYPARASPVAGPVPLLALNEAAGCRIAGSLLSTAHLRATTRLRPTPRLLRARDPSAGARPSRTRSASRSHHGRPWSFTRATCC
jgi:hypothetical protein